MPGRIKFPKMRARFSIFALMLVVALSAGLIYDAQKVSEIRAIRTRYLAKVYVHTLMRKSGERQLKNKQRSDPVVKAWVSELVHYQGDLEKKYMRAASRPWVAVEPDPPRPPVPTIEQLMQSGVPPGFVPKPRRRRAKSLPWKLSDLESL